MGIDQELDPNYTMSSLTTCSYDEASTIGTVHPSNASDYSGNRGTPSLMIQSPLEVQQTNRFPTAIQEQGVRYPQSMNNSAAFSSLTQPYNQSASDWMGQPPSSYLKQGWSGSPQEDLYQGIHNLQASNLAFHIAMHNLSTAQPNQAMSSNLFGSWMGCGQGSSVDSSSDSGALSINPGMLGGSGSYPASDPSASMALDGEPPTPPLRSVTESEFAIADPPQHKGPSHRRRSDSYCGTIRVRHSDRLSQKKRLQSLSDEASSSELPNTSGTRSPEFEFHRLQPFEMTASDELDELEQLERGGVSMRKDKRRLQNRFAQRAFRARSKVNRKEAVTHVADIEDQVRSQDVELAKLKDTIARLQRENVQLKGNE